MIFSLPGKSKNEEKEMEKKEQCQDLARETENVWYTNAKVVSVVVGVLG